MDPRLSLITLGVQDLTAARAFYENGLGWPASPASQETIVFFQLGGLALALYPEDILAEEALAAQAARGFRGFTLAHNVRSRPEVSAILTLAEKAGGKIVKPARDVFWGGHSGYFSDLDGFLWEVAWNPFFEINARGEVVLPEASKIIRQEG